MTKNELEDKLKYMMIPDILYCMESLSAHNREGEYQFECDGNKLIINFKVDKNYAKG